MKIKHLFVSTIGIAFLTGCGNRNVFYLPDDCLVFMSRGEASALLSLAQAEQDDGSTQIEALAAVTRECVDRQCSGDVNAVCAVSCASCADDLTALVFVEE